MKCSACGAEAPAGARFCASCGQELLLRGDERRVVTVLFGDLVGFTKLSETLDPEQVRHLVDGRFERLVAIIENFGGRVDKIIGDAVVALFGAPVAHEDDAERAVRAALRMQEAMAEAADVAGGAVEMRIGVNTGEVLVGALRAGGDYTAMGDVVNTASRLQTNASPGEVLVGPETYRATRSVVSYQSCDPISVKGRSEPVQCWIALDPVAPPGHRPNRPTVPLIGRAHELGLLTGAVATSASRGRAALMLVNGEAGVGKSRLAAEVACWAEANVEAFVLEGRCVPYGEANVWWPVAEALRHGIGVALEDDLESAREVTSAAVQGALGPTTSEGELNRVTSGLLHLMGHEDALTGIDTSRDHDEAVRALVAFTQGYSRTRPVLVVMSDLHWADEKVLGLLDTLLERLDHDSFAVLATARASLTDRWSPRAGHHSLVVLHLDPLSTDDARILIHELGGGSIDDVLAEALLARSGGNPFFLEELVSLLDEVDASDELPSSLRALVAARLDSLATSERAVLDDAAVLGRRGPVGALATMAKVSRGIDDVTDAVDELVHRELFDLDGRHWEFRSELVREVAYSTLTKADRAGRHAGIAKWCLHNENLQFDSVVERVAHHYARAAELASDFESLTGVPSDVDELARTWLGKAAKRAERNDLGLEAARLYSEALALRPASDEERRELELGRARGLMLHSDHDQARSVVNAIRDEAGEAGHRRHLMLSLTLLGDCELRTGRSDLATRHLDEALELSLELDDPSQRAEIRRLRGMVHVFAGDDEAAFGELTEALELFESLDDRRGTAWVLQHLSWSAFTAGRAFEAEKHLRRAIDTFDELGDAGGLGWALGLYAWVAFHLGDSNGAEWLAGEVLDAGMERGDRWGAGMMHVLIGSIRLWTGRTNESISSARAAIGIFDEVGDRFGQAQAHGILGRALVTAGRIDEARQTFDAFRDREGRAGWEPQWQVPELLSAVQIGDIDWASSVAEPIAVSEIVSEQIGGTDAMVALGLLSLQQGDIAEASQILAAIADDTMLTSGFVGAAAVLLAAARGDLERTTELVEGVLAATSTTYLDRSTARLGHGLCVGGEAGRTIIAEGVDGLADTGDRVAVALLRLADAALAEAADADDREQSRRAAETLVDELGVGAEGWRRYIDRVITATSSVPAGG